MMYSKSTKRLNIARFIKKGSFSYAKYAECGIGMRRKLLSSRNGGNRTIGLPGQMRDKLIRTTEEERGKEVTNKP